MSERRKNPIGNVLFSLLIKPLVASSFVFNLAEQSMQGPTNLCRNERAGWAAASIDKLTLQPIALRYSHTAESN